MLCLFAARSATAAVTLDNSATAVSPNQVSSLTWSHTVGAGTNRILVVGNSFRDGNVSASTVTYGGTALILGTAQNSGGNQNRTEMWYLFAPTVGTANVVISMSASKAVTAASLSYVGVKQTVGTFASATAQSTTASVSVSSATGDLVIDTVTANGDANSLTAVAPQTSAWNVFSGSGDAGNARGAGGTQAGAATTTVSWTLGASKPWSVVAMTLPAAPSSPSFVNLKTVQITSDPVNGSVNPKFIPGAYALYSIQITNQGAGTADNNTVVISDVVPANTSLFVADLGSAGSGPVGFANGSPSSGLTYTFTSLASSTDDLSFSNNSGTSFTYTPVPDGNGFDANVTNIKVSPKGTAAGNSGTAPSFTLTSRVKVK